VKVGHFLDPDLDSDFPQNHYRAKILSMSMETLEFIIHPDGRVQEKATGIVGSSCTKVTAEIEAAIGRVVSQSTTEEFFAPEVTVQAAASNKNLAAW
jgi:hypothetical protein